MSQLAGFPPLCFSSSGRFPTARAVFHFCPRWFIKTNRKMGEIFKPGNHWSEAARALELKAHNFSGGQVDVPLSSRCPHVRSKQNCLFNYFLPILLQTIILTPPNLLSIYYEAFTSKINGAWASQTHWTSFMQKPSKIILPERPPQRLYYTYCVRPKPGHRRRVISCCTKQSVKDKR